MNYAIMPMDDYKAVCDKIREKADLINIKFENTDFGYIRSEVFTPTESGEYIFTIDVKDESKLDAFGFYFAHPDWQADNSPGVFEVVDSNELSGSFGNTATRIFIDNRLGLQPSDIISATLSYNGEIVEIFADTKKIKSGELVNMVEEVHKAGQLSVIESIEAFKGRVSGNPVVIDDIIHIEHDVDVNVLPEPSFTGLLEGCTFEDTDFGYIRSSPFEVTQSGEYSFALTLTDDSKWYDWVIAGAGWAANDSPPCSGSSNPSKDEWMPLSEGYTYRLFLNDYKGLKAADILSGTIEIGKNAVAPPVGGGDIEGVKVTVSGKNFFNPNLMEGTIENSTAQRVLEFGKYYPGFHYNNIYSPSQVEYFVYDGNTFSFKTKASYCGAGVPIKVKPNTTFRARADMTSNGRLYCAFYTKEGVYISYDTGATVRPATTPENCEMLLLVPLSINSEPCTISNIQLEVGKVVSDFELYVEPTEYTSNADGIVEGVKSIYPSMSISTDTEGVNINVNYYRDIDKVINNTAIAVALSGGE